MTTENPSKVSINAFLQIFATKMPYLRFSGIKTPYLQTLVLFICICIYLYLIFGLIVYISKIQLSVSKLHSLITLLKSLPDEPVK